MKNPFNKLFTAALLVGAVAVFGACSDDDDSPKSYPVTVGVTLGDGLTLDDVSDLVVVARNSRGATDTLSLTNGQTSVVLRKGTYTITVSGKVKDEATAYVTGSTSAEIYSENVNVSIPLSKMNRSTLIFKTIYNAGSIMGYVKDTFFEIVNNSDEVQYLDGVILFSPQGNQQQPNAWQANGITDTYPAGQGAVVCFPGSGKEHPLQPGESVIVANDAVDHRTLSDTITSPDLSNADWEIYLDYSSREIDYPAPNLTVLWTNNRFMAAWGLGFMGRAFVLARLPEGTTPEAYAADASNFQTTPGTSSTSMEYMMMPSKYVLDAVDVWNPRFEEHYGTFLPKDDAQGVLSSGLYTAKCQRRKVSSTTATGRKYYQDTNNSSEDFLTNQPLVEE